MTVNARSERAFPDWLTHLSDGAGDPAFMKERFPWAERMVGCPHDALYHAEGDPWVHTCMVAAGLEADVAFQALPSRRALALRLAAWFHDVAKPHTTVVEWCQKEQRERVRQPRHAPLGARMAWQALIDAGAPADLARDVHALVFWHQRPGHMPEQKNNERRIIGFSCATVEATWADLLTLCRNDQTGRVSPNVEEGLEALALTEMLVREAGDGIGADLMSGRWPFQTSEARLRYLRAGPDASAWYTPPYRGDQPVMVLMSGLPGSGKNSFLSERFPDLPVVELDAVRRDLGVGPGDNQGRVAQEAIERARAYLRAGESFAWNATCLSVQSRQKPVSLARDYGFSIEAYAIDVPAEVARGRNGRRDDPVPAGVMDAMIDRREPIGIDEASRIHSVDTEGHVSCLLDAPASTPLPDERPAP